MRQRTEALQSLCETMGNAAASALAEASRRNPIARRIDALSLAISLADRKKFRESGTQLRPTPKNGASIDTQKSGALKINFLNEFKDWWGKKDSNLRSHKTADLQSDLEPRQGPTNQDNNDGITL